MLFEIEKKKLQLPPEPAPPLHIIDTSKTPEEDKNLRLYFFLFLQENCEILLVYIVYSILTNNSKFNMINSLKISAFIAGLMTLLDYYNPKLKSSIKSGVFSTIGSSLIKK